MNKDYKVLEKFKFKNKALGTEQEVRLCESKIIKKLWWVEDIDRNTTLGTEDILETESTSDIFIAINQYTKKVNFYLKFEKYWKKWD